MKNQSYQMKTYLLIAIIAVLVVAIVLVACIAFGRGSRKHTADLDVPMPEELGDTMPATRDDQNTAPGQKPEETPLPGEELHINEEPKSEIKPAAGSVWDGYWYLFNAENKYCTEYQFHEDETYQVRERYVSTGKYKTKAKDGIYNYDDDYSYLWLFLDDDSVWCHEEEPDLLWTLMENSWGSSSEIVMVHYPSLPEASALSAGYDIFMEWSERGTYSYDSLVGDSYYLMFAYPSAFQETSTGGTYADGAAMEPLDILLTHVNSYWTYKSEDAKQALFYHIWDISEDFESEEMVRTIEQKYNLGKGNYMVEEESYWDVDGFRLLLNINGRWHFIRSVIHESTNEMVVMEYSFTGENYWPYNPTIAHLEYNLQFVDLTE